MPITHVTRMERAVAGIVAACAAAVACSSSLAPDDAPVTAATIVGRWDLQTLDHKRLPVRVYHDPLTGQDSYVVEAHLVLDADGTYRRWGVTQVLGQARRDSVVFVSTYAFRATPTPTITLRIDPGNEGSGRFADRELSITYTDFLDWWDETFVRSR